MVTCLYLSVNVAYLTMLTVPQMITESAVAVVCITLLFNDHSSNKIPCLLVGDKFKYYENICSTTTCFLNVCAANKMNSNFILDILKSNQLRSKGRM